MAPDDIRAKLDRQPFQPMRIHVSDGPSYDILRTSHAFVTRMELIIGIDPDTNDLPRRSIYVDPRHVTRIEPLLNGPDASPRSNGDRR